LSKLFGCYAIQFILLCIEITSGELYWCKAEVKQPPPSAWKARPRLKKVSSFVSETPLDDNASTGYLDATTSCVHVYSVTRSTGLCSK